MNEEHRTRKLKSDFSLLESAIEDASWEQNYYLDLETGEILVITDETRRQFDQIHEECSGQENGNDIDIGTILAGLDVPDWEKEVLREANRVERESGTHTSQSLTPIQVKAIVTWKTLSPPSRKRLHERLTQAISGCLPFPPVQRRPVKLPGGAGAMVQLHQ